MQLKFKFFCFFLLFASFHCVAQSRVLIFKLNTQNVERENTMQVYTAIPKTKLVQTWVLIPSELLPEMKIGSRTILSQTQIKRKKLGRPVFFRAFEISASKDDTLYLITNQYHKSFHQSLHINLLRPEEFRSEVLNQEKEQGGEALFTFFLMGALSIVCLISLVIFFRRKSKLYLYYFLYGFSTLVLLYLQYWFDQKFASDSVFYSKWNLYSRIPEFLQMLSLWSYIQFVVTLLDLKQSNLGLAKILKWLSILLIVWGLIEVIILLYSQNTALYEHVMGISSAILFPIFILVIVFIGFKVKHHLIKYVIWSNSIFVTVLILGFIKSYYFPQVRLAGIFTLPFATLLESIVLSFSLAAKIEYDADMKVQVERQLAKVEMSALRSQMNPHFLFNSMNSIRSMILMGQNKSAEKYLVQFSRLLRQILEYSREETITLEKEIEILKLYLSLESSRFQDDFFFDIQIEPEVELEFFFVPPLLLQPFVENALIHGLRKSTKATKELNILIKSVDERNISIFIKDNGVGRGVPTLEKDRGFEKKSLGTQITQERVALYNVNETGKIYLQTIDELNGTIVKIDLQNGKY